MNTLHALETRDSIYFVTNFDDIPHMALGDPNVKLTNMKTGEQYKLDVGTEFRWYLVKVVSRSVLNRYKSFRKRKAMIGGLMNTMSVE